MIYTMNQENPKDRLSIFDNFQVDQNLPKFKKEREEKADDQKKVILFKVVEANLADLA